MELTDKEGWQRADQTPHLEMKEGRFQILENLNGRMIYIF
jgi:hypothetical protein